MSDLRSGETISESVWRGISAPILVAWAMGSFLPLFTLIGAQESASRMIAEGMFFATGFGAFLGLWVFARFAGGERDGSPASQMLRGRERPIRIYAWVWVSAYTLWVLLRGLA